MNYTDREKAAIVQAAERWANAQREYLTRLVDGRGDGDDKKSVRLRQSARVALSDLGRLFGEAWGRRPAKKKPSKPARRKLQAQLERSSKRLARDLEQQVKVSPELMRRVFNKKPSKPARVARGKGGRKR